MSQAIKKGHSGVPMDMVTDFRALNAHKLLVRPLCGMCIEPGEASGQHVLRGVRGAVLALVVRQYTTSLSLSREKLLHHCTISGINRMPTSLSLACSKGSYPAAASRVLTSYCKVLELMVAIMRGSELSLGLTRVEGLRFR